ncbi:MarR family transcriptional regulator [Amycolatopsis sp. AA4]|uniref:MarR family winged helix-turn-helix transcriptional regulator n=1 Tax=Actinomycetes TaxID=1760 RepID=UPI0001DEE82A|nr:MULTISPECIES: MarR family transcriptional regulator [Actinomycetes]ATY15974.1 MarR family transcriptional regulator [Amycolatopsis sp. AA4]EFL12312.1 transcriptional regulator [Streptomyces sp. AA4]
MSDDQDVRWLDPAEQRAWRAYIVASLRLRQRLHRELTESHGISLADYEVLVCLNLTPDRCTRMTELAALLGSTKSRLSHQIGKLEVAGLVTRRPDPEDKRGVLTELTDAGLRVLAEAAPTHVRGAREHLIDLLTPDEQTAVATAFTRVLEHLDDVEGRRDTLT